MAFNFSAQLQLQAPTNLAAVAQQISRGLSGINVQINLSLSPQAQAALQAVNQQLARMAGAAGSLQSSMASAATSIASVGRAATTTNASLASTGSAMAGAARAAGGMRAELASSATFFERFGAAAGVAVQRFAAFVAGAGGLLALVSGLREGLRAGIEFERQMNRIEQVSGESGAALQVVRQRIGELSTGIGASSADLAKSALILAQVGLSAKEVAKNLETLALASAAPNFDTMTQTAEGMIAVLRQFKTDADGTKEAIGAMNEVAAKFAVEASDLVTAVRKSGGAFSAAGGDIKELLALFTSVRSTTRESADEIATGLRTIFARTQRADVVEELKAFQVQLRYTAEEARAIGDDRLKDMFVGPYEAIRRLSSAIKDLPSADPRFSSIVEALGGYRQISRVIPLLQQFGEAEKALAATQVGSLSLYRSTEKAQESLTTQAGRTKEQFLELFRVLTESQGFKAFAQGALQLASSLATVLEYAKPLVPVLLSLAAVSTIRAVSGFFTQTASAAPTPPIPRPRPFNKGGPVGVVPGTGDFDSVPMTLPSGSFVIRKKSAQAIGYDNLAKMAGGGVPTLLTPGEAVVSPQAAYRMGGRVLRRLNEGGTPSGWGSVGPAETPPAHTPQDEQAVRRFLRSLARRHDVDLPVYHPLKPLDFLFRAGQAGEGVSALGAAAFANEPGRRGTLSISPRLLEGASRIGPGVRSTTLGYVASHELGHLIDAYAASGISEEDAGPAEVGGRQVRRVRKRIARAPGSPLDELLQRHRDVLKLGHEGAGLEPQRLAYLMDDHEVVADALALTLQGTSRVFRPGQQRFLAPGQAGEVYGGRLRDTMKFGRGVVLPHLRSLLGPYHEGTRYADGGPVRLAGGGSPARDYLAKLMVAHRAALTPDTNEVYNLLLNTEHGRSLLGDLPEDLHFAGLGTQALVLGLPGNREVARFGLTNSASDPFFGRRPNVRGLLQANSFNRSGRLGVERLDRVHQASSLLNQGVLDGPQVESAQKYLEQLLASQGYRSGDMHINNFGVSPAGEPVLFDPGYLHRILKRGNAPAPLKFNVAGARHSAVTGLTPDGGIEVVGSSFFRGLAQGGPVRLADGGTALAGLRGKFPGLDPLLQQFLETADGRRLLSLLPGDASHLGHGAQAVALALGKDRVARLARLDSVNDPLFTNRPNIPGLLQALSAHREGGLGLEILPRVRPLLDLHESGEISPWMANSLTRGVTQSLLKSGHIPLDAHAGNIGLDNDGLAQLFDSGLTYPLQKIPQAYLGRAREVLREQGYARGGSPEDTVPALLTPGEFVFNRKAVERIGPHNLSHMNRTGEVPPGLEKNGKNGKVRGYNQGGYVHGRVPLATGGETKRPARSPYEDELAKLQSKLLEVAKNLPGIDPGEIVQNANLKLIQLLRAGKFDAAKADLASYASMVVRDTYRKMLAKTKRRRMGSLEEITDRSGRVVEQEDRGQSLDTLAKLRSANVKRTNRASKEELEASVRSAFSQEEADRLLGLKRGPLAEEARSREVAFGRKATKAEILRAILQARQGATPQETPRGPQRLRVPAQIALSTPELLPENQLGEDKTPFRAPPVLLSPANAPAPAYLGQAAPREVGPAPIERLPGAVPFRAGPRVVQATGAFGQAQPSFAQQAAARERAARREGGAGVLGYGRTTDSPALPEPQQATSGPSAADVGATLGNVRSRIAAGDIGRGEIEGLGPVLGPVRVARLLREWDAAQVSRQPERRRSRRESRRGRFPLIDPNLAPASPTQNAGDGVDTRIFRAPNYTPWSPPPQIERGETRPWNTPPILLPSRPFGTPAPPDTRFRAETFLEWSERDGAKKRTRRNIDEFDRRRREAELARIDAGLGPIDLAMRRTEAENRRAAANHPRQIPADADVIGPAFANQGIYDPFRAGPYGPHHNDRSGVDDRRFFDPAPGVERARLGLSWANVNREGMEGRRRRETPGVYLSTPMTYDHYGRPVPVPGAPEGLIQQAARADSRRHIETRTGARPGEQVSRLTTEQEEYAATLRARRRLGNELLSAERNLLARMAPHLTAMERERMARENVERALRGEVAVARDGRGRLLGTRPLVDQATEAGVGAPGAGGLRYRAGQWFGGIGNAIAGARSYGMRLDQRLSEAGANPHSMAFGLSFGLPLLGERFSSGDAEVAVRGGNVRSYENNQGIGGALTGAGVGAIVGSSALGPLVGGTIGTLVGLLVGAVTGWINAIKDAKVQVEQVRIDESLRGLSDRLSVLAAVGAEAPAGYEEAALARIKEFREAAKQQAAVQAGTFVFGTRTYLANVEKADRQGIGQQAAGFISKLHTDLSLLARDNPNDNADAILKRLQDNPLNETLLNSLALLQKKSVADIQNELKPLIVARQRQVRLEDEGRRGAVAEQGRITSLGRLVSAIEAASAGLLSLRSSSNLLAEAFEGQFINPARTDITADSVGRLGSGDPNALPTLGIIRGVGGREGADLYGMGEALNRVGEELPAILATLASRARGEGANAQSSLTSQFDDLFRERFGDKDPNILRIRAAAKAQLNASLTGEKGLAGYLEQVSADVTGTRDKLLAPILGPTSGLGRRAVDSYLSTQNEYADRLALGRRQETVAGESRDRVGELRLQLARMEAEFSSENAYRRRGGESLPLDSLLSPSTARQAGLVVRGGLPGSSAFDPDIIADKLRDVTDAIARGQDRQRTALLGGDPAVFQRATRELDALRGQATNLSAALKALADSSQRLAVVQEKLSVVRSDRAARLSLGERIQGMEPDERSDVNRALVMANQAERTTGNLDQFVAADRRLIFQTLRMFGEARLTGFNGMPTGNELADRFAAGGEGGTFELDKERKGELESLQKAAIEEQRRSIRAQERVAMEQGRLQEAYFSKAEAANKAFLDSLGQLLAKDKVFSLENERAARSVDLSRLNEFRPGRDLLARVGLTTDRGVDTVRGQSKELEEYSQALRRVRRIETGYENANQAIRGLAPQDLASGLGSGAPQNRIESLRELLGRAGFAEERRGSLIEAVEAEVYLNSRTANLMNEGEDRGRYIQGIVLDVLKKRQQSGLYYADNKNPPQNTLVDADFANAIRAVRESGGRVEGLFSSGTVSQPALKPVLSDDVQAKQFFEALGKFGKGGKSLDGFNTEVEKVTRSIAELTTQIDKVKATFQPKPQPENVPVGRAIPNPYLPGNGRINLGVDTPPGQLSPVIPNPYLPARTARPINLGVDAPPGMVAPVGIIPNPYVPRPGVVGGHMGVDEPPRPTLPGIIPNPFLPAPGRGPIHMGIDEPPLGLDWRPSGTDRIPAMLSENEYVVRAESALPNRDLLDAINFSRGPLRLADGGPVNPYLLVPNRTRRVNLGVDEPPGQARPANIPNPYLPVPGAIPNPYVPEGQLGDIFAPGPGRVATDDIFFPTPGIFGRRVPEPIKAAPRLKVAVPERLREAPKPVEQDDDHFGLYSRLDPFGNSGLLARQWKLRDPGNEGDRMRFAADNQRASLGLLRMRQLLAQSADPFQAFGVAQADSSSQRSIYDRSLQSRFGQFRSAMAGNYFARFTHAEFNRRTGQQQRFKLPEFPQTWTPNVRMALHGFAQGGLIPEGMAHPALSGEDRAPILAAPGEFILPRNSVSRLGLPFLESLRKFAQGGLVGSASSPVPAGAVGAGLSPEVVKAFQSASTTFQEGARLFQTASSSFSLAVNSFNSAASELGKQLAAWEGKLQVSGSQRVEIVLNGAEALARLTPELSRMIQDMVRQQLLKVFRDALPDIQVNLD